MERMKRCGIFCLGVLVLWSGFSGCVKKTKIVTKPREDQALAGNQGYLLGTPPPSAREAAPARTYYETEVEIPTIEMHIKLPKWRREWEDKELSGNRGYLVGGPQQRPASTAPTPPALPRRPSLFQPRQQPVAPAPSFVETEKVTYDTYTVKKGETLGEIAARPEIYGTSRAWKRIYEANQEILKDPNRIKPGQVLRIPRGGESPKASRSSIK